MIFHIYDIYYLTITQRVKKNSTRVAHLFTRSVTLVYSVPEQKKNSFSAVPEQKYKEHPTKPQLIAFTEH